jgi:antitoxin component YwqK of YwqJK toxin-antitoxin module
MIDEYFFKFNNNFEGEYTKYVDGQINIKCNYINGKKEGEQKEYYMDIDGYNKYDIHYYKNDKIEGENKSYYENGQLSILCHYKNNKLNGKFTIFNIDGSCKLFYYYIFGYDSNIIIIMFVFIIYYYILFHYLLL